MISYEVYKIMHILGFVLIFIGLAGVLFAFASTNTIKPSLKILGFATHGLGLLLVLTGGFGMLARLGMTQAIPGWVWGKIAIWGILAAAISLSKRKSQWALPQIALYSVLVVTAASLAIYKPF